MGCGASKQIESQIVPSTIPSKKTDATTTTLAAATGVKVKVSGEASSAVESPDNVPVSVSTGVSPPIAGTATVISASVVEDIVAPNADKSQRASTLVRSVVPSISVAKMSKAVAFEIPLDEDSQTRLDEATPAPSGTRGSLPKLSIDINAKLANAEARWKDLQVEQESKRHQRRRTRTKPELSTKIRASEEDPIALKRRILEKEAQAAQNRLREIEKLQLKLARQEERVRQVLERKKALGHNASHEELNLSWGGEDNGGGLMATSVPNKKVKDDDADSGKGSSRSGSGRSTGTFDVVPNSVTVA